jgi:hypothetical protein
LPPLYYRGCWHRVSRGLFRGYRHHRPPKKRFTTRRPSSRTRRCSFRLAPIDENSLLLPPVGVWAVLSPSLAVCPLRPATRHWLGRPLPHQRPDGPRAPPPARCRFPPRGAYAGLAHLSMGYPPLEGRFPRVPQPCATEAEASVRLACIRHAASVRPEPGSNSSYNGVDDIETSPLRGVLRPPSSIITIQL